MRSDCSATAPRRSSCRPDPWLVDKVRDIVGLYVDPPAHAVVLCVDEKPQIQALDRTAPLLPMLPGRTERRTHDYCSSGLCAGSADPAPACHESLARQADRTSLHGTRQHERESTGPLKAVHGLSERRTRSPR